MYEHYKDAFIRYADFQGRTSLQGFWYFILNHFLVFGGLLLSFIIAAESSNDVMAVISGVTMGLYALGSFVPVVAAAARRLRDTGKSPYLLLLNFVPFGGIILFVLLAQRGQHEHTLDLHDHALGFADIAEPIALPELDIEDEYV